MATIESLFARSRRQFLTRGTGAVGLAALASLLAEKQAAGQGADVGAGGTEFPNLPVRAKRIISRCQIGLVSLNRFTISSPSGPNGLL